MRKTIEVPVIHYTGDHIPDHRPGKLATAKQFDRVREMICETCSRFGYVGPYDRVKHEEFVYWVIDDQYSDERYQYVEIIKPKGMSGEWLHELMATLKRCPQWGVGIANIGGGYLMVLADRLMVTGPCYEEARTFDDVVQCSRRSLDVQQLIENTHDDSGLQQLSQYPELRTAPLRLSHLDQVTDRGLQYVASFGGVACLDLDDSFVSDSGLIHLKSLTHLETLSLSNTRVTDAGLIHLKSLTQMDMLSLSNTRVTGVGLTHFADLPMLKILDLCGCALKPSAFRAIAQLRNLREIYLDNTPTSDAGLVMLEVLENLTQIHIRKTQVSKSAVKRFRSAKPICEVATK
jgi:hypothetical protein